jgi:glucuronoarabinoxylan endo-1,4-beta-xylanase
MKNENHNLTDKYMNTSLFILMLSLIFLNNIYAQTAAIIDLDSTHQMIRGFGAANILQWRPDMTDSEIGTAFGTGDGQLGFSILRLRIQPETSLWSTNVPTAKKAQNMGVLVFASPWDAPSDMLETVNGQKRIRHDRYEDYAHHLEDFNYYMENHGVPIYAISVQNEPDYGDWTRWTAGEMVTFMREHAHVINSKIMAPESFQFRRPYTDAILNDSLACDELDIVGGHIYGGGLEPYPLAESKGKEIWMTEHYTDSNNSGNLWPLALDVGVEIHNVMTAGMNAYIWWYIVRFYGPISDGTNDSGTKGDVTKRGYIMSQYSRFIRPGYFRIQCTSYPQRSVFTSAYIDCISSNVVIVAINSDSQVKNQAFAFKNGHVETFTPYITSGIKDCSRENDISVTNDTLKTTLNGKSVTTFVSGGKMFITARNSSDSPESFNLFQNFPNPFNSSTTISFSLPSKSSVLLKVFDLMGRKMATLVNGELPAGHHSRQWNASKLSSGVYFCQLTTNTGYRQIKKLLLLR